MHQTKITTDHHDEEEIEIAAARGLLKPPSPAVRTNSESGEQETQLMVTANDKSVDKEKGKGTPENV